MRIYLVGAQSTGKTTVLNYITDRYNINKITEVAREVLAKYGNDLKKIRSDIDLCKSFQMDIIEEQIQKEKMTEEPYICDRGIDILAYFAMHTKSTLNVLEKDYVKDYIQSYTDKDSLVIFVRPQKEIITDDGIRGDLSLENIYQIDGMIKYILESNDINYLVMKTKHMNERIRFLDTLLEIEDLR